MVPEDRLHHSGEGMGAEAGSWLIASSSTCRGREEKERWGGNRQKWNWAQSKLSVRYFLLLGTLERLHSSPESTTALGPSVQIGSLRGTSFKPQSCAPVAPPYGSQKNMKKTQGFPKRQRALYNLKCVFDIYCKVVHSVCFLFFFLNPLIYSLYISVAAPSFFSSQSHP